MLYAKLESFSPSWDVEGKIHNFFHLLSLYLLFDIFSFALHSRVIYTDDDNSFAFVDGESFGLLILWHENVITRDSLK